MSRLDDLPADQRATLQLLLKQGKTYDELASLLRLEPSAVRDRALNALDALGPEAVSGLTPERQDEISDYLLGQQRASQRAATRSFLEGSAAGRGWARTVAGELKPLAADGLPEIPADADEVDEAFGALSARRQARDRQEQSSKVGGVILLVLGAAIVAVLAVLLVSKLGGDDKGSSSSASVPNTPASTQADTTTTGATGATDPNGGIESQIPMTATKGNAIASGFILKRNGERVFGVQGQFFPPTNGKVFNYAVWLHGPGNKAFRMGYVGGGVAATGQNKGLLATGAVPSEIAKSGRTAAEKAANQKVAATIRTALTNIYTYDEVLVTREPANKDSATPGPIVVSGPITKPK